MPLDSSDDFDAFDDFDLMDDSGSIKMAVYIKPAIVNNEPVWSIHTSDGNVFATVPSKAGAEALASQNDFNLVSLN